MPLDYRELIEAADKVNLRLEVVRGIPIWEASPVFLHQQEIKRIVASIRKLEGSSCVCLETQDTLFRFPDGSLKRPDIAVLCKAPDPSEVNEALRLVPAAVVEVVSVDYEYKDLELGPPFYLESGVKDVVVFDPRSGVVLHHRPEWDAPKQLRSPTRLELECGCEVTV
jgi:Uma2 family endonuclease